jgi:hypothetical protein
MPCVVAMLRRLARLAAPALIALVATWPFAVALASDPPPAQTPARGGPDRQHPDAAKINQANSKVIHAGPGTPITGALHVPPAQAKKEKKSE